MATECVVAIDVGGTNLKGAVVDRRGRAVALQRRPTRASGGSGAVIDGVFEFAEELAGEKTMTCAVGLAVPGIVDESSGTVIEATNIGWRELPLRELAERRLGLPVVVNHDVRAGALAEGLVGAARGCSDYLVLALGTGVGAAIVIGGRPYTGAHGLGGELGHVSVAPHGRRCGCGGDGCLEALASAGHIAARYQAARADPGGRADAAEVAELTAAGDPVAAGIWQDAVEALGRAIANYTTLLDPELVVIGGGMAAAGELLFAPVRERVDALVQLGSAPPIVPAMLAEAGRHGAAIAAWRAAGIEPAELRRWSS